MNIWLPYVSTGGGADVWSESFAEILRSHGHSAEAQGFDHRYQYAPWALRAKAPKRCELVVCHSWFGLAFKQPEIPLVAIEHLFTPDKQFRSYRSLFQTVFHEGLIRQYVGATYRTAAATVAVSDATQKQLKSAFPGQEVQTILNGVDLDFFTPGYREAAKTAQRPFRLLFAGNFIRRKGVDLLPAIMQQLGEEYELSYTGGSRDHSANYATSQWRSLGRLNREGMRQAYRDADLLIFPSRLEGLPLAVLEAAACGLPVVAANTSSLPECVVDGITGRLCPVDDIGEFVHAVRKLTNNKEELHRMAKASRALAEQRFDIKRMNSEYCALFERVLRG